jgi:hypothetical protein
MWRVREIIFFKCNFQSAYQDASKSIDNVFLSNGHNDMHEGTT